MRTKLSEMTELLVIGSGCRVTCDLRENATMRHHSLFFFAFIRRASLSQIATPSATKLATYALMFLLRTAVFGKRPQPRE